MFYKDYERKLNLYIMIKVYEIKININGIYIGP